MYKLLFAMEAYVVAVLLSIGVCFVGLTYLAYALFGWSAVPVACTLAFLAIWARIHYLR